MSLFVISSILIGILVSFFLINKWRYRVIVKQYCSLSKEEQLKVGIYPAFEISLFACLGLRPSRVEMGLRYNEYLYMDGKVVIPYYRSVTEFR